MMRETKMFVVTMIKYFQKLLQLIFSYQRQRLSSILNKDEVKI